MRFLVVGVALLLAGCGEPARSEDPIVVQHIESSVDAERQAPVTEGGVAGYVVDQAFKPIAEVTVMVPGLERETKTDPEGRFGLSGIPAGGVFLRAEHPDHLAATAEIVVRPGDVIEVRLVMQAVFREPYVVVEEFSGYTELSSTLLAGVWTCTACTFQINPDPGATAMVIEAGSSRGEDPIGMPQFYWRAYSVTGSSLGSGFEADPMRLEWLDGPPAPAFSIQIEPTDTVPYTGVAFEVYVAAFYNGADPAAWTMVGGI